jgi:hypothetical protein
MICSVLLFIKNRSIIVNQVKTFNTALQLKPWKPLLIKISLKRVKYLKMQLGYKFMVKVINNIKILKAIHSKILVKESV